MLLEGLVSLKTFLKQRKTNRFPAKFAWEALTKSAVLYRLFFQRHWPRKFPRNSREIGRFFREFVPENPAKFDFFSRDLPEASVKGTSSVRYGSWGITDTTGKCEVRNNIIIICSTKWTGKDSFEGYW